MSRGGLRERHRGRGGRREVRGGGGGGGGCDGGPGPAGGFCCHLVPGAWLVITLGLGVCACCCLILGAESWRASFLSILAASWVFLLSILAFVFSIICSWAVTWGGGGGGGGGGEMGGGGRERG